MKIGILMGGISSEREVSLSSGNSMMEHINKEKYEVIPVVIDKKEDLLEKVKGLDFALLALHGKFGEDGTVQAVLDTLGIPYSGCDSVSSSLCMDKDLTKSVLKAKGIRTARWLNVSSVEEIDYEAIEEMGYPVFIKPTNGGSSVATFKITKGDEITCPVFDNELFPVLAIKAKTDFYDYEQKYSANGAEHYAIDLEPKIYEEVKKMALDTYKALKCSVYSRIDMIITEDGTPYVLEGNTLPGMTATSLFPQSASEKGISYPEFIDMIIDYSLKKNN